MTNVPYSKSATVNHMPKLAHSEEPTCSNLGYAEIMMEDIYLLMCRRTLSPPHYHLLFAVIAEPFDKILNIFDGKVQMQAHLDGVFFPETLLSQSC